MNIPDALSNTQASIMRRLNKPECNELEPYQKEILEKIKERTNQSVKPPEPPKE
jgi:hypothetical protein